MDAAAATVLVVRPRAQADAWVGELAALGVPARALPLIDIVAAPDPARVESAFAQVEASAAEALGARVAAALLAAGGQAYLPPTGA